MTSTYADIHPGTIFTNSGGDLFIAVQESKPYPNGTVELSCVRLDDGRSTTNEAGVLLLGALPLEDGRFTDNPRGLVLADGPVTIRQHNAAFDHHTQHIPPGVRADQHTDLARCQARDELLRTAAILRDDEDRSPRQRNMAVRTALRTGLEPAEVQQITGMTSEEITAIRDVQR